MKTWIREDGRFFTARVERGLFGLVVVTTFGGRMRPARVRSIPVESDAEAECAIEAIGKRWAAHGYVPTNPPVPPDLRHDPLEAPAAKG